MKKIIFAFFLILSACHQEYKEHFYSQREIFTEKNFVDNFISNGEIIEFPNSWEENFLINAIDNAKNKIWIEIYSFTKNENIYNALVQAKNRGVDVRILLEWNVYGTPTINVNTFKFLEKNSIPVAYTDNNRYAFTHSKFWIIDDTYFISTWNWTQSFFSKNREYIYTDSDEQTREFLEKIFIHDFEHKGFVQTSEIPSNIVISPLNSRQKIENFIDNTQKEIFLYVQTISDEKILEKISEMSEKNIKIIVCTADNETNRMFVENFENIWKIAKNPYLHAKIMISDGNKIFIWSQNFTTNSIENNREIGIILENREDLYNRLQKNISEHCGL